MLTVDDLITASGKYPERKLSHELDDEVKKNLNELCIRVNSLFKMLKMDYIGIKVSSGFRPSDVNSKAGGAKKSAHMVGKAVDIIDDKNQSLAKIIEMNPHLLERAGLMMENYAYTKGKYTNWVHLDMIERPYRKSFMFNPESSI